MEIDGLKELTLFVVLVEIIALGVFCGFLAAATASQGGVVYLDMTQYGEQWIEYWLMVVLVGILPYAIYYFDNRE